MNPETILQAPESILGFERSNNALWKYPEGGIYPAQRDLDPGDDSLVGLQWQALPTENHSYIKQSAGLSPELVTILNCEHIEQSVCWSFSIPVGTPLSNLMPLDFLTFKALLPLVAKLLDTLAARGWLCTRLNPETLYFDSETDALTLIDPGALIALKKEILIYPGASQFPPEAHLNRKLTSPEAVHAFVLGQFVLRLLGQPAITPEDFIRSPLTYWLQNLSQCWQKSLSSMLSPLPEARPKSLRKWLQSLPDNAHFGNGCNVRLLGQAEEAGFCTFPFWHPSVGAMNLIALFENIKVSGQQALQKYMLQKLMGRLFTGLLNLDSLPLDTEAWQKMCHNYLLQTQQDLIRWCDQSGIELFFKGGFVLLNHETAFSMLLGAGEMALFNPNRPLKRFEKGMILQRETPKPHCQKIPLQSGDRVILSNQAIYPLRERILTPYNCAIDQVILEAVPYGETDEMS